VQADFAGELESERGLPLPRAVRALAGFSSSGVPGAEKSLLLARRHPVLALDSNGGRGLTRLGIVARP
jgi:hypothetical protein